MNGPRNWKIVGQDGHVELLALPREYRIIFRRPTQIAALLLLQRQSVAVRVELVVNGLVGTCT